MDNGVVFDVSDPGLVNLLFQSYPPRVFLRTSSIPIISERGRIGESKDVK
jgi:hypothetical protein